MLIIHKRGSTHNMHIRQAIGLCVRHPDDRSTIIIHLIHLSALQIRRLLRLNPSTGDHFRGTCLRLLIEAIRRILQLPSIESFVISGSIIAVSKAKRMRQRLFALFHNAIRGEIFFLFFFQIDFRKNANNYHAIFTLGMSTWIVAFLISGLTGTHCFVQLNGQWRVTIPTLAYRLAWQINIPVSLFSRDRKVRCKRAQAHVPLKDWRGYFGKERITIDLWRHRATLQLDALLLNRFVEKCIDQFQFLFRNSSSSDVRYIWYLKRSIM